MNVPVAVRRALTLAEMKSDKISDAMSATTRAKYQNEFHREMEKKETSAV